MGWTDLACISADMLLQHHLSAKWKVKAKLQSMKMDLKLKNGVNTDKTRIKFIFNPGFWFWLFLI